MEKKQHHPWEIWKTTRGNFRAKRPNNKERSFKTYKDAANWLQSYREKQQVLSTLKTKYQITPRTELKKILGYIRDLYEKEREENKQIDFRKEMRKIYNAISKIHIKML